MSSSSYTSTIPLGLDLSYYRELKVIFCSNIKCTRSINYNNTSRTNSTTSIVKKHLTKHNISLKEKEAKTILEKVEKLELASFSSLASIENYKYYFKELGTPKEAYYCLVKDCNKLFINYKSLYKHLREHLANKDISSLVDKKQYYKENILVQSLSTKKNIIKYFIIKNIENNIETNSLIEDKPISSRVNLVESYKQELKDNNNSILLDFNTLEKREIPSGINKTKFYLYLNNKNINSLLKQVTIPIKNNSTLEENIEYNLFRVVETILYSIEPLVNKLNRRLRQQLQTEVLATNREKNLKDFSLLSSKDIKRKYYKFYSLFIVYLYRIYKEKAKDKSTIVKQPIIINSIESNLESIIEYIKEFIESTSISLEDSILDIYYSKLVERVKPCLFSLTSLLIEQPLS